MAPGSLSDLVLQAAKQNGSAILEKRTRWFRYTRSLPTIEGERRLDQACGREREPLGRPFRQAQDPEPVEGLGALIHSTPLRVILSLSNG